MGNLPTSTANSTATTTPHRTSTNSTANKTHQQLSELDEFLQSITELQSTLNSTSLDDRLQHLISSLRQKGMLPPVTDGSGPPSSKKLFEPGIVSTEKYEWCSPRSDQLLSDLEASEAFGTMELSSTSSPRLRQLRDLSWSVRGVFWENQVKRALLFAFVRRRWSNDALVHRVSLSPLPSVVAGDDLFATTKSSGGNKANTKGSNYGGSNNGSNTTMLPGIGFQGIPGTGLPPYARLCIQMVMQLASMQLSRLAIDAPSQALQFVQMMKMNMVELRKHNNQSENGGESMDSTYDQAMASLGRAMVQLATSDTPSTDPAASLLRAAAAEIVIELSLMRQKLSGLVQTQLMLIQLSTIDPTCQLRVEDGNCGSSNSSNSGNSSTQGSGMQGSLNEIESHLISPLAAPAPPPAGLGMIHTFLITAPPQLGAAVRSRRIRSPPVSPTSNNNNGDDNGDDNDDDLYAVHQRRRNDPEDDVENATAAAISTAVAAAAASAVASMEETEQEEKNHSRTRSQRATAREVFIRSGRAAALGRAMHSMRVNTGQTTSGSSGLSTSTSRSDSALIAQQIVNSSIRQALEEASQAQQQHSMTATQQQQQMHNRAVSMIENRRYQQSPQPPSSTSLLTTPLPVYRGNNSLSHPLRPRVLRGRQQRSTSPMTTTSTVTPPPVPPSTGLSSIRGLTTPSSTATTASTGHFGSRNKLPGAPQHSYARHFCVHVQW